MSKRKGTRNEHKAMRILERAGYACTRSAASLGLFDIIALDRHSVRLIQVKSNRHAGPIEREAICEFTQHPENATKEVWIFYDYHREPRIEYLR